MYIMARVLGLPADFKEGIIYIMWNAIYIMARVLGLPADFKEGIIFSTYATLVSAVQKGGQYNIILF